MDTIIKRTIDRICRNAEIKISVNPLKGEFHSDYITNDKDYMTLGYSAYLSISMTQQGKGMPPSVSLTNKGLSKLVRKMKVLRRDLQGDSIFYKDKTDTLRLYSGAVDKFQQTIFGLGYTSKDQLRFIPSVMYDENERTYESVAMFIQSPENMVSLSIDEFESMIDLLSKIDIYVYGQMLVNYYASTRESIGNTHKRKFIGSQSEHTSSATSRGVKAIDDLFKSPGR